MAANAGASTVREQGSVTLQCPKLTESNYTSWSILVETVLRAHGLWKTVAKYKDAQDVWESIQIQYLGTERVQKARLQTLRGELERIQMKETETIDEFSGKIGSIVEKFKSLGSSLEEEVFVRKFLNSVSKKYLPIVASIEQHSDLESMPLEEAVGRLKVYEDMLKSHDENEEEQHRLMWVSEQKHGESSGRGRGRGRNFERGGRGRGRGRGRGDKSGIRCYDCGEFGHFSYECTKWKDKDNEKEANLILDDEPTLF